MLNTPDAMLNGQALEKVLINCAPSIKHAKKFMIPDLNALFLSIKIATSGGKYDLDRTCPKCEHENNFEVNCQHFLDSMSFIEESDTIVNLDSNLIVHVKPYTLEMRQIFLQKEFNEEITLKAIDNSNETINDIEKAKILAESMERLTRMTFGLVANSIDKIVMVKEQLTVTDQEHISEWLISINKSQADVIIKTVENLNNIGINNTIEAVCTNCSHTWTETLNFDPINFFGRR